MTENTPIKNSLEHSENPSSKEIDNGPSLPSSVSIRSFALTGIFLMLLVHGLYVAAPIIKPMALAYLLSLLLSPTVRRMKRLGCPEGIGAAIVLMGFIGLTSAAIYGLSTPAEEWIDRSPQIIEELKDKLKPISKPIQMARDVARDAEQLASPDGSSETQQVTVEVAQTRWITSILTGTPIALANIGVVIVLLYFLLAGGDTFLSKLVAAMPNLKDKKKVVSIVRDIQTDIAHYLLTFSMINACLGLVVAICLYFLGMPNPFLWGALVGTLNFVPYLGPAISALILTPVAFLSYDTLGQAMIIPAVVIGISMLEGQFITPQIIGKRLSLSPVVVFVAIVAWGWLWGVLGALMAIPIIVGINVVCQRIEVLNPVSDFMSSGPARE